MQWLKFRMPQSRTNVCQFESCALSSKEMCDRRFTGREECVCMCVCVCVWVWVVVCESVYVWEEGVHTCVCVYFIAFDHPKQ